MDADTKTYWQCIIRRRSGDLTYLASTRSSHVFGTLEEIQKYWRNHANNTPAANGYQEVLWMSWDEYEEAAKKIGGPPSYYREAWEEHLKKLVPASPSSAPSTSNKMQRPPDKGPLVWEGTFASGDDMMAAVRAMSAVTMNR